MRNWRRWGTAISSPVSDKRDAEYELYEELDELGIIHMDTKDAVDANGRLINQQRVGAAAAW
jgi:hypothetical protein